MSDSLLLWALGTVGWTYLLIHADPLAWYRWGVRRLPPCFWPLAECYFCVGFWTGLFVGLVVFGAELPAVVCCPAGGSLLSWLTAAILGTPAPAHGLDGEPSHNSHQK